MRRKIKEAENHGISIGISLGLYEAYSEARAFYESGDIDFWFEWQSPKTLEQWKDFEALHGTGDEIRARYGLPSRD